MLLVGCLLHIKLDWKDASESMGFLNWGTLLYPCFWCTAERDSLHTPPRAIASTELPFELTTIDHYEKACNACEIAVHITIWRHVLDVRAALILSGFAGSGEGRYLRIKLPHLGLERGDRTEPSRDCPDYESIFLLNGIPALGIAIIFFCGAAARRALATGTQSSTGISESSPPS